MNNGWNRGDRAADYEYDDYPIPRYDPSIPPEERERLKADAQRRLDETVARIKAAHAEDNR